MKIYRKKDRSLLIVVGLDNFILQEIWLRLEPFTLVTPIRYKWFKGWRGSELDSSEFLKLSDEVAARIKLLESTLEAERNIGAYLAGITDTKDGYLSGIFRKGNELKALKNLRDELQGLLL